MTRIHRFRVIFALLVAFGCGAITAYAQVPPAGQVFGDVPQNDPNHPEYAATLTLFQLGISVGCDLTPDFCPGSNLTRGDMAAFIVKAWSARVWNDPTAFDISAPPNKGPDSAYFSDAPYGSAQFDYIQKLYELGITNGTVGPTIDPNTGALLAQGQFAPNSTLTNYQIATFLARARSLADFGCASAYYTVPKPFTPSSNPNCAPNGFPTPTQTPYFSDVGAGDNYFKYIQRMGDLGVFQSPSSIMGYPGCPNCQFYENNTILRSQMAIWTVTGMGLVPESVLSIAGGSNVYSTLPTITVPFTFTLYDQPAASIRWGEFLLQNSSFGDTEQIQGPLYCYGAWNTADLKLEQPTEQDVTGYNNPLANTFCTISLVSVTPVTTLMNGVETNGTQATVNFTFTPNAQGAIYNVFHEVVYTQGQDPWENVGTLTVGVPTSTVILTDLTTPSAPPYLAGDNFTVTVTGPAGQAVAASSQYGGSPGYIGTIPGTSGIGVLTISGQWQGINVGTYAQLWYVGGTLAAGLSFVVAAPPAPTISAVQVDGTSLSSIVVGVSGQIAISGSFFGGSPQVTSNCSGATFSVSTATTALVNASYDATSAAVGPCNVTVSVFSGSANAGIDVVPAVTIWDGAGGVGVAPSPGVPVGGSITYLVSLSSNSSSEPIMLSLGTSGTGTAQFDDGTQTKVITTTTLVTIEGLTVSNSADDLTLLAAPQKSPGRALAQQRASMVTVSIALRNTGTVSSDNSAAATYATLAGTSNLGQVVIVQLGICSSAAEFVGTVSPANYAGSITLRRAIVGAAAYVGQTFNFAIPAGDDTSLAAYLDSNPQSGGSGGKVYDVDGPGTNSGGGIGRYRNNFSTYAVLGNRTGTVHVSSNFLWWARSSCTNNASGQPIFSYDVSNDNQSGTGTTKTTWNLQ